MSEQWWKDPIEARQVARWSFIGICMLGGYVAVGPLGGLVAILLFVAILVAAFFEARGSLFFLQYAPPRTPGRRAVPPWWPWLVMLLGSIALLIAGTWLGGFVGDHVHHGTGQFITAAAIAGAGALFFAGLFTLLGYWIDRELSAWMARQGDELVNEEPRRGRPRRRDDRPSARNGRHP
jgi:hypothetical protein